MYNSLGENVYTSAKMFLQQGNNKVELNSHDLSSGIYFVTIKAGEYSTTRKVSIDK